MALPTRTGAGRAVPTIRWDPFREIEDAWARMGSLLGDVVGEERRPHGVLAGLVTAVDVEETDDEFLVELELPGIDAKDVSIDLRDNELLVTGEIKERERRGKLRRQTRRVGQFEHRIALPGDVDPDSVSATLDNGVLTVRLAKAHRTQPRHIEISGPTSTPADRTLGDASGRSADAGAAAGSSEAEASDAGQSSAQTSGAGSSSGG